MVDGMTKKNKQKGPMIYVGPGFRDTDLATFKIYADGIPAEYDGHPVYRLLFVTPAELNAARQEIKQKGTVRNVLYHRAIAEHNKKGGN